MTDPHTPPPEYDPSSEPLRYRLNFCDIARFAPLAPVGDAFAALWLAFTGDTECPCCLGFRLLLAALVPAAAATLLTLYSIGAL